MQPQFGHLYGRHRECHVQRKPNSRKACRCSAAQEDDADNNPAVQLYKLVMRAVRESNVFNVGEKKTLRRLLVGTWALSSL